MFVSLSFPALRSLQVSGDNGGRKLQLAGLSRLQREALPVSSLGEVSDSAAWVMWPVGRRPLIGHPGSWPAPVHAWVVACQARTWLWIHRPTGAGEVLSGREEC